MKSVINFVVWLIEKFPSLQKPIHQIWSKYLYLESNAFYFLRSKNIYKKKYIGLSDQDKWVIETIFNKKENGFFLDIGAYDGFFASNTYILEKDYGWNGICVEPVQKYFNVLKQLRRCICVEELVDRGNDEVTLIDSGDMSGIVSDDTDHSELRAKEISKARTNSILVKVKPITLYELLKKYNAPKVIDYFSLDVEGAEERIMINFPFEEYIFLSLTIERPTPKLNEILFKNGYIFVKNSLFDSFYVHKSLPCIESLTKEPFKQINKKAF